MLKKLITTGLILVVAGSIFVGCGTTPASTTQTTKATDAVTSASLVDNEAAFEKSIAADGPWIISTLKDLTFDKELVLDGDLKNGKKDADGKEIIQRKLAFYTQDADRKVLERFTVTTPKLTINSLNARIQGGTLKGDVYVSAKNFQIVDATIDGNLYFMNEDAKSTFKIDDKSKVTGKQEMKQ